jgi:hypothetical protein
LKDERNGAANKKPGMDDERDFMMLIILKLLRSSSIDLKIDVKNSSRL